MRTLLFCAVFVVACDSVSDTTAEANAPLTGAWKVTMPLHDGISCSGVMQIDSASPLTGAFYCQDSTPTPTGKTFPASTPGTVWITYGKVSGSVSGDELMLSVTDSFRSTVFVTDTLRIDGQMMVGPRITAAR